MSEAFFTLFFQPIVALLSCPGRTKNNFNIGEYTRPGLPPTPIAMPGSASLRAAVRPEASKALYFVSRGDGTSEFSETLAEHNRAVNKYQRGR